MAGRNSTSIDLTGQRFGRLTVLKFLCIRDHRGFWKCLCDCGKLKEISTSNLRNGGTRSCGCFRKEFPVGFKHGCISTAEYKVWASIKNRCLNKRDKSYPDYGGRGIIICQRWLNFENFIADMGLRPSPNLSIERIDNDGNYEKDNCKWATITEQNRNKRSNIWLTFNGKTQLLIDWARETEIEYRVLYYRIKSGKWSTEEAFYTPVKKRGRLCQSLI